MTLLPSTLLFAVYIKQAKPDPIKKTIMLVLSVFRHKWLNAYSYTTAQHKISQFFYLFRKNRPYFVSNTIRERTRGQNSDWNNFAEEQFELHNFAALMY